MEMNNERRRLTRSPTSVSDYSGLSNTAFSDNISREDSPRVSCQPSPEPRHRQERKTMDEVIYNMRYSHENQRFDWSDDIEAVKSGEMEAGGSVHQDFLNKLREQPLHMQQKLKLSRYLRSNLDADSMYTSLKNRTTKSQASRIYGDFGIGLWRKNITKISAYHGSNVASYFLFLRFLTYLNVFIALLLLAFISVPQILSGDATIPDDVVGYFGELSTSVMFYGAYSNTTWGYYERPMAYFLTWGSVNLLSFIVIILSMLFRFRRTKYSSSDEELTYTWRLFTSWDYSVYEKQGASDRKEAIKTAMLELVREDRGRKKRKQRGLCSRCLLVLLRLVVNVLVLAVLGGSGYLIFLVANIKETTVPLPDFFNDFLDRYELPLVVTGLKLIVPLIFDQLIRLEQWHPRTELKLTIGRTTLFYVASLIVFVVSLYDVTTECIGSTANSTIEQRNASEFCCWENEVGEQVFKVLILDLGITLVVTLLFDVLRAVVVKSCGCIKIQYSEMAVASGVLDLTYGQALVWLGLYFCPFLALAGVVKLVILFYFQYVIARTCYVAPRKVFRASRSGNFYMFILLLNLFFSLLPLGYAVIELQPSDDCGPFQLERHVYDVIAKRVGNLPDWLQDALDYIATPSVIIAVIILLLLIIFYYMARSSSYKEVGKQLRKQLTLERTVEKKRVFAKARALQGRSSSRRSGASSASNVTTP
ncbi:transmembrane channel-like protein 3 [Haliotis rufescens]|uniref:transmembrane channel-like protein 3 n=1 Tax=Haliotis rufescens TaxID=6454 RepID=UPI00201F4AC9|nr:transmembrane channel-like protein 3 [Haliotis rufescens]